MNAKYTQFKKNKRYNNGYNISSTVAFCKNFVTYEMFLF